MITVTTIPGNTVKIALESCTLSAITNKISKVFTTVIILDTNGSAIYQAGFQDYNPEYIVYSGQEVRLISKISSADEGKVILSLPTMRLSVNKGAVLGELFQKILNGNKVGAETKTFVNQAYEGWLLATTASGKQTTLSSDSFDSFILTEDTSIMITKKTVNG